MNISITNIETGETETCETVEATEEFLAAMGEAIENGDDLATVFETFKNKERQSMTIKQTSSTTWVVIGGEADNFETLGTVDRDLDCFVAMPNGWDIAGTGATVEEAAAHLARR